MNLRQHLSAAFAAYVIALLLFVPAAFARHERTATQELKSSLRTKIVVQRHLTWHFEDKLGTRRTPTRYRERHASIPFLYRLAHHWKQRHSEAYKAYKAATAWPAHHALWMCIHGGEGAWGDRDSGGNGHWGGLQMHPGWGYGTSYHASDDSQLVQEQAAERAYRESGYSAGFLIQQWGQTIGPCWKYAE